MAARVAWQPQPERLKTGAQACRVLRLRGLVAGQTEDHPKGDLPRDEAAYPS